MEIVHRYSRQALRFFIGTAALGLLAAGAAGAAGAAESRDPTPAVDLEAESQAAYAAYAAGDIEGAGERFERLLDVDGLEERLGRHYARNAASCFAEAGQPARALAVLERAVFELGEINFQSLEDAEEWQSLRGLDGWARLVAEAKRSSEAEERRWGGAAFSTPFRDPLPLEERLAGLSHLWATAKYNSSNFDLVPELDWDAEYLATIPKVIAAESTYAYYLELQAFVAKLKDGHSNVYFPRDPAFTTGRARQPAISIRRIDGRVILTHVGDPQLQAQNIQLGDELLTIDGEPIDAYANRIRRPYVAASTAAGADEAIYSWRLLGGSLGPVAFGVRRADGSTVSVQTERPSREVWLELMEGAEGLALPPAFRWRMLPQNIAVVELNSFGSSEAAAGFEAAFAEIAAADGVVFDLRRNGGGSSSQGYSILAKLTDRPFAVSSYRTLKYIPAFRAWGYKTLFHESTDNVRQAHGELHFRGPVAVLIGPETFSAAEDFAVAFDVMDRGALVGRATGGSTGQPLYIDLPGGGQARIVTKRDTYPDGRDFVGSGVQPDVKVTPTVEAFREGRDLELEAAVKVLQGSARSGDVRASPD
ncbi:MAG: S41 family peptidase, partial [Acidobacteriota bacterium]